MDNYPRIAAPAPNFGMMTPAIMGYEAIYLLFQALLISRHLLFDDV